LAWVLLSDFTWQDRTEQVDSQVGRVRRARWSEAGRCGGARPGPTET